MLIFLYCFTFSATVATSLNGENNILCDILTPCSFDLAKEKIQPYDILYIKDIYVSDPVELESLRNLFFEALKQCCIILSDNMTINGSLYRPVGNSFIFDSRSNECQITGFNFIGFRSTILCFRGSKKAFVSKCSFSNNDVTGGVGLLIFGFGNCKIFKCQFFENRITNTSLISVFTTLFFIERCSIDRNIQHTSKQGMILSSNAIVDLINVTFDSNATPYSSLIQLEWRSYLSLYNTTFSNNVNSNMMICNGICSVTLFESLLQKNKGTIFKSTTEKSEVIINDTIISDIFSGERPLFDMPAGDLSFPRPCIIENNTASTFVDFHNKSSKLSLIHVRIKGNRMWKQFININKKSNIKIKQSAFLYNSAPEGIIVGHKIFLSASEVQFEGNIGQPINCQICVTKVSSCSFSNVTHIPINITGLGKTKTILFGSDFTGVSSNLDHFYIKGNTFLAFLRFNGDNMKMNPQNSHCFFCEYNQKEQGYYTLFSFMLTYGTIAFVLYFFFTKFKSDYVEYIKGFV